MELEALTQPRPTYDELLDAVELQMNNNGLIHIEPEHCFTPGLYTRSIKVPAGIYLLSHIHKTDHQFILSKGLIMIYDKSGMKMIGGTWIGKTLKGTRRFAKTVTEIVWTSIHATDIYPKDDSREAFDEAVALVEHELFEKHENIYLIKEIAA